jgi:hypothetical protein
LHNFVVHGALVHPARVEGDVVHELQVAGARVLIPPHGPGQTAATDHKIRIRCSPFEFAESRALYWLENTQIHIHSRKVVSGRVGGLEDPKGRPRVDNHTTVVSDHDVVTALL